MLRLLSVFIFAAAVQAQEPAPARVDYYRDVRPILTVHCYRCHSADTVKGKLRLDLPESAARAIVKGKSSGFEANALRTSAWRYRDYVVRRFNEDTRYDRFLMFNGGTVVKECFA